MAPLPPKARPGSSIFSRLLRPQTVSEAHQILRMHANNASTRAVNIRDEQKRDGQDKRQNQPVKDFPF